MVKHPYSIKKIVSFLAVTGVLFFASAPAMGAGRDMGCSPTVANPCTGGGGSGGGYNGPTFWDLFGSSGPSAADIAAQQARSDNDLGVQAYKRGDWAAAIAYFKQSLQKYPNDPTYRQNLINAEANLAREKAAMEEKELRRQNKVATDNMQQSIQNFAHTLNASPISGGLDFDGRSPGSAPDSGNSGGLDFTATVVPPSNPTSMLPSGDPMVVNARNVPPGLPKGLDTAITSAYSSAPPGVSDRVRKGFQAVMERDWKVAKAWFQEALNRDPTNAGLERLVALTDSSQVDGLSGTPDAKKAGKQASKAKPASISKADPSLQLPDPEDINFLFPGIQKMKDREATEFKTLPNGKRVQMPQDSDVEYLFGSQVSPKATPTYIIGKKGQLVRVPENTDQESTTYVIGKDGKLMELPQAKDSLLMFPENDPAATSK